jgi:hypothetical protein
MPEESTARVQREGMGYEKIEKDGEVSVEKGEVRLRRVNGEDLALKNAVKVAAGDQIYWIADCIYTRQHSA